MALVIFDCDGVLVDSEIISARCVHRALTAAGYETDEAAILRRFLGISNASMCKLLEEDGFTVPDDFLAGLRLDLLHVFETELQPIPGIADVLAELDGPRCVASSSNPERIQRALEITGLIGWLAPNLFSATMVSRGKPKPDLFLFAAERMAEAPEDCIVIEDSEAGVTAGRAAGMRVLGFTGGGHVRHDDHAPKLLAAGADRVFEQMTELPDQIAQTLAQEPLRWN